MLQSIVAGDTLEFANQVADYPATEGWTLKHLLRPITNAALDALELVAAADGADYLTTIAATVTSGWDAGDYVAVAQVSNGSGERHTLDAVAIAAGRLRSNIVTILANPAEGELYDARSHARKTLAAIEAVLYKRASKDQMAYTIEGRSLERTPLPDLIALHSRYQNMVKAEEAGTNLAAGLGARKLQVRF